MCKLEIISIISLLNWGGMCYYTAVKKFFRKDPVNA